ncbi:cell division protein FtsK [Thiocystis minor]|uniref:DNA translocase FtsK n=1 Tax=Thiocystis minor TaxID=61597 RepID=UPI0019119710|nr:DNA translocase FtsK [Thiocystis minor]MBK5963684.1 cell division protein FtsK [Thiocystis minor]
MAQATRYGQLTFSDYVERALREGAMWTLMCVAIYLTISLMSYSPADPGWSYVSETSQATNAGGRAGAWFADAALTLFGFLAYLLPFMVAWSAWLVFRGRGEEPTLRAWLLSLRWVGFLFTIAAGCGLASMHVQAFGLQLPTSAGGESGEGAAGGWLGRQVSSWMLDAFNAPGADLLLVGALLVSATLFSGISWLGLLDNIGAVVLQGARSVWTVLGGATAHLSFARRTGAAETDDAGHGLPSELNLIDPPSSKALLHELTHAQPVIRARQPSARLPRSVQNAMVEPEEMETDSPTETDETRDIADPIRMQKPVLRDAPPVKKILKMLAKSEPRIAPALNALRSDQAPLGEQARPPLDLLDAPRKTGRGYSEEQIEDLSRQVESNLADFGVEVRVVAVYPGPVVTLFELQLAPGIKASKITGLARDLARALSTISVRVVEIIPGKSVIGIEIPNKERETVFLREIFASAIYQEAASPLTLGMGTNISGLPVVVDLARMPHALIAGTTGSGKSVAINAMILSLLYKAGPEDVRLIMVDPKMLELSVYEGIPHLLTPVVTDMKEAANALRWCVGEMERRYRLMAKLGVRNIGGYNRQVADAEAAGEPIPDPILGADFDLESGVAVPTLGHLPYIVVIIDELADMMMVVGKKVEELIARLAQKARASGIHLLLATQRPSVDVLTGLIKANIPTRIAFQVSSRIDSRTVLDQMGAEQLLGHGDMLYLPPGGNIPQRVHGAFVDDHEVHHVVDFLKQQYGPPSYIDDVLREPSESLPGIDPEPRGETEDTDPLFDEAVQIVVESRRASISGVQRRLKIGYNRAARMIEEMERIGIVGAAETNGNREVLAPPPVGD